MVKGISRQVIVVRSPDPKLFEQAIFILREDALGKDGRPALQISSIIACSLGESRIATKIPPK